MVHALQLEPQRTRLIRVLESPPRDKHTPKKPPNTAPAKRSVKRTLSWTRRTSKHIEADTNAKQREIAL